MESGSAGDSEIANEFRTFLGALGTKDNIVRVFKNSSGPYSIYGQTAIHAADDLFSTQSVVKLLYGLPSLTMSRIVCERFIRQALCVHGKRVELYSTSAKRTDWRLEKEASPGNLQALQDFFPSQVVENSTLLSIQVAHANGSIRMGYCFVNTEQQLIGTTEVIDTASCSSFEALVIQLGVREIILNEDLRTDPALTSISTAITAVLERCGVSCSSLPAHDFRDRISEDDFAKVLLHDSAKPKLNSGKLTRQASSAVFTYLGLHNNSDGRFRYWNFDGRMYMRLDGSALKALNMLPHQNESSNKSMSLFGHLNRCRTIVGTKLLLQWLNQPLINLQTIEERHALVEIFLVENQVRDNLQAELKSIPDLSKLVSRLRLGQAHLEDVVRAYQVTLQIPSLLAAFAIDTVGASVVDTLRLAFTDQLNDSKNMLKKFEDLVETTVDLSALDRHEYLIRADFDENLERLWSQIDSTRVKIDEEHRRVAGQLNVEVEKKLKLENHSTYGFCLRLSRGEASVIRNQPGFRELQTSKAGVYFTSNKLGTVSKQYADLYTQYSRHQVGLVKEVVAIAASYSPVFDSIGTLLARLDVVLAFAEVALHAPTPYVRPKMYSVGSGSTILRESRHPCVEVQDGVNFIPNDVDLTRGHSEFLIITGANMGGKSTFIRQIGTIILMAQIGCFVPCKVAEITIVDSILARVGAGDSQLKGLSTFMSECLETSAILQSATKNSLIIIDELGRGTSTTDGFGLAYAIAEHIVDNIGSFALFATHFHELTALGDSRNVVKNLHVSTHLEAGCTGVTLLYKVVTGICNQSFGIHVARIARFPDAVVSMAQRKLDDLEQSCSKESSLSEGSRIYSHAVALKSILQSTSQQSDGLTNDQFRRLIRAGYPETMAVDDQ